MKNWKQYLPIVEVAWAKDGSWWDETVDGTKIHRLIDVSVHERSLDDARVYTGFEFVLGKLAIAVGFPHTFRKASDKPMYFAYKGYQGDCRFNKDEGIYEGKILDLEYATVSFQGATEAELAKAFIDAVEDWEDELQEEVEWMQLGLHALQKLWEDEDKVTVE